MAYQIFTYNSQIQIVCVDQHGNISQAMPNNLDPAKSPNKQRFAREQFVELLKSMENTPSKANFITSVIEPYTTCYKERIVTDTLINHNLHAEIYDELEAIYRLANARQTGVLLSGKFAEDICYKMAKFIESSFKTPPCTWKTYD